MGFLSTLLSILGCDAQRISELEAGVSTEQDVRAKFGEPEKIWDGSNESRLFEYNRQPAGHINYMIKIDLNGKYVSTKQVLTPENFATIVPGMKWEDVRMKLGKPANERVFALKPNETYKNWRWLEQPNNSMIFSVVLDKDLRVIRTEQMRDPEDPKNISG